MKKPVIGSLRSARSTWRASRVASADLAIRSRSQSPVPPPPANRDPIAISSVGSASSASIIRGSSVSSCRSEEHTSELQSLLRISYAVFCLTKKNTNTHNHEPSVHKITKEQKTQHDDHTQHNIN